MGNELRNKKIAILANDGSEESELTELLAALRDGLLLPAFIPGQASAAAVGS
jgi:hypothetical protein